MESRPVPPAELAGRGTLARVFLLTAALIAACLFARTPAAWLRPYPVIDDLNLLAYYFHWGAEGAIPLVYMGYGSLLPDLILWAAADLLPLPLDKAPFAIGAAALAVSSLVHALPVLPAFSFLSPSLRERVALALLLALLPLALRPFLTGALWLNNVLLFAFVALALFVRPDRPGRAALWLGTGLLAAWSHPLSVLCLPLHAGWIALSWRRAPVTALAHAAMAGLLAVYAANWIDGGEVPLDLGRILAPLTDPGLPALFFQGVAVDAVIGREARDMLTGWLPPGALTLLGGLAVGAMVWILPRRLGWRAALPLLLGLGVGAALVHASLVVRHGDARVWLTSTTDYRFLFVPRLLFLLAGLACLVSLAGPRRRMAVIAGLLALVLLQNGLGAWRYHATPAAFADRAAAAARHDAHSAAALALLSRLQAGLDDPSRGVRGCWDLSGSCELPAVRQGPRIGPGGGPPPPPDTSLPPAEIRIRSAVFDLWTRRARETR
ncbi:MAG: hypothetical protein K9G59_18350 [Caulobacter sp.]|nr:hypothetical protein [Caulobacter sp.]